MYKLTRPDGLDFYSGIINYRESIGTIIRVTDFDPPEKGACGRGLHASKNPNDCFIGAKIPCAAFRVIGIQPIAKDEQKTRYRALKVVEEITDLDTLFGWKYSEAINPINPFQISPPEITEKHIALLVEWSKVVCVWSSVWSSVWSRVGSGVRSKVWRSVWDSSVRSKVWISVWDSVGISVRSSMGSGVWDSVGSSVEIRVGSSVRDRVRSSMGSGVWDRVRSKVGISVGSSVGAYIGSLFPGIKWEHIKYKKGEYPFQPAVDLWKLGLVPSYDGKIWRLHGGEDGGVVFWREI